MKILSYFLMLLVVFGSFAPFASAQFSGSQTAGFTGANYGAVTNTYQSSRPNFDSFYSGSYDTYWPILNNLEEDQCDSVSSDFIIGIPPGGCSPMVVRSDLLAEQNVPVFCQLSAIRVNPLIDVSTIKSISFKQKNQSDAIAGISFHPARAAVKSYRTLLGSPIDENIGYVVIVLKQQPDERNLEEEISGMLTATVKYDAQGAFGTGAAEYYLEPIPENEWKTKAADNSFWAGKGYLRVIDVDEDEATIEVMTDKTDVYRTVTLKEGETSNRIYYPGQYCTAAMTLKLNKIDNSEDMAKVSIEGDIFWVRKGSKLLGGKCVVKDLNIFPGGSGSIDISCSGNSKFSLVLGDSGVVLNNGTANFNVGIGGSIKGKDKNDYSLAYYGRNEKLKNNKTNPNGKFAVLIKGSVSEDDVSTLTKFIDNEDFDSKDDLMDKIESQKIFGKKYLFGVLVSGGGPDSSGIKLVSVGVDSEDGGYGKETFIPKYLDLSEETVSSLIDDFPAEKKENGEYWGEEALYQQIALAGLAKDESSKIDLINRFLMEYPGSSSVEYMRDLKLSVEKFDYAGSSANVFVNNNDYNIRVEGFSSGSGANDWVTVKFGGGASSPKLKRGKTYDIVDGFKEITDVSKLTTIARYLTIVDIDGSSATLSYVWKDPNNNNKIVTSRATIKVGEYDSLGGVNVQLVDTEVREVAYVSLIPEVRNTKTEANFTFNINVEKRLVELSPEKAQRKVDRLNKTIADWEDKVEKLGKLVSGLKAACLATSTVLTIKSFVTGLSGGVGIARGKIMDVYEAKCKAEHAGMDLQECYSTYYKEEIERDISAYGAAMIAVNKKVECAETDKTVSSGFLDSRVIDSKAYVDKLRECTGVSGDWEYEIRGTKITRAHLDDASDWRAVLLREEACKDPSSESCKLATKEMEKILADNVDRVNVGDKIAESKGVMGVEVPVSVNSNFEAVVQRAVSAKGSSVNGVNESNFLARVRDPNNSNNEYYVELDKSSKIVNVYNEKGVKVTDDDKDTIKNLIADKNTFIIPSGKEDSCSNQITKPYVRYYEQGNKQGFAAIVPVDRRNGWYAQIENSDYDASGMAKAFSICNVGKDGEMGDGVKSGDMCQLFQISSAGSVSDFVPCPGMSSSAVKRLYQKAESLIRDANRNGNGVNLDGEFYYKTTPLGPSSTDVECTDFMSVDECSLMFNVCDPVICPTSRCDLGGKFPVSDVIASGIIGSIALCLPNFGNPAKGGVVIPICLSGIHAGLDTYVSILKSHKQCLEENIKTGRYTGICDEITAIYTCEFFWGQISPVLDVLLVKLVEGMYGGSQIRGGAEYLTVQKSFDNLDKSVDYFSNNYMKNSFRAFDLKNTEEIGSTICKAFIGTSVPTSADTLDSLLEPESPPQFYAYFSDDVFSDATVPSTSHYKVYYHIYAGNDMGAQYRVYLKSPPASSYYSSRQTILVDSGYAAKGVAADEAIDFTAPTGYQELCVSINGQDECGFGSVTSDFGLNYASQAYVADQADDKQITTTKDCVTTSSSGWGMVSPNLQAGVEKTLGQDDIATTGIIRICASTNPDKGVVGGNDVYCKPSEGSGMESNNTRCSFGYYCNPVEGESDSDVGVCKSKGSNNNQVSQGKWVDVGYCDNVNMRCWLDSTSVKENLGQYMAVNDLSVSELVRDSEDLDELNEQYKTVKDKILSLKKDIEGLKGKDIGVLMDTYGELTSEVESVIVGFDEIAAVGNYEGQGSNVAKAEALSLKASVYRMIVEKLVADPKNKDVEAVGERPVVTEPVVEVSEVELLRGDSAGFTLDGTSILSNGVDTKYYIEEKSGNNYVIKKLNNEKYPIKYGDIFDGKIEINAEILESGDNLIDLEDYTFDGSWFTLKDSASEEGVVGVNREDVFVVGYGSDAVSLSFRFISNTWEWSPDKENWMKVPSTIVSGGSFDGKIPVDDNGKIIKIIGDLEDKNYDEGKSLLTPGLVNSD